MERIAAACIVVALMLQSSIALGQGSGPELMAATAERSELQETVHLDGVIEAVQQSTVSAQTSGTVQSLPYDVDDSVAAGDLIVQLEDSEQRSRLRQAQAGLEEAEAALADASQRFERIEAVHERGLVSRQEFDQARNNLAAARARVERAKGAVSEAQEQLSYTRVLAPYGGILTERHVEVGESVNPGQPLLSGLSLEQLRVVVDLPQKYAELARTERQAQVTLADGRVLETGEMTFYPYANPQTHTFRLRMRLSEPNGSLFPGMLVKVSVPVTSREALWVPASSLIQRSELRAVFVLDQQDQPRLRQVRTGVRQNGRLEILAGLSEGERVVTNPSELVGSDRLNPAEGAVEESNP
ncbi:MULTISPECIES: efflux RND transporter periplasmic adaptor subunit [Marinobacter]|jgi:RND family efflux transporter MFP subunit|uniref:efflux RND transporter periplasmic adaptor subunit n=1 Tax=Marinobacter TaxID=2742 RepID=UPI0007D9B0FC|nr:MULTISPECIES: efflux RND transporter periplasmic adaptor subunit [unclassified Marinobacter]MBL3823878.1 efflux RND transporter periplasmic adaptor subunit [Marinobacter sp. MC3]MBL3892034.1 efflux RND transporter periplasmic adaptor subunit [Marinobacter sp. MW3]OAN88153.1 efflux transporter periplasmic adaptor subunit [Marinobacter sp. EhN04]OAN91136.1 efflux transporter periplasmic adaptor subunit [Marinobacter sp. EhC06]